MMLKCLKITVATALIAAAGLPAAAQDPSAETVVATVNGTEITLGHMIMIRAALPQQYQELPDDVLWEGIMEQLIQQTVLTQAGPDAISQRVALALDNEERSLRAAEFAQSVMDGAVTEAAISEEYAATFSGEDRGVEYNAAHILVETEEEATDLAKRARDGEDFGELAKEHSTGPSGPNGGALGWFGQGRMVAEFEEAVKTMGVGDVSDPVQTQFGWHVIKLNETRVPKAPELEEVREDMTKKVREKVLEERLNALVAEAEVESIGKDDIDTSLLRNFDLVSDQ